MTAKASYVMTDEEVAWGYLVGYEGTLPQPSMKAGSARDALENVVLEMLQRTPSGVAFSGGRDSSTVLAVAVHVARREGLPLPVPITRLFPEAPSTDESEWQELVIRHLGLDDWIRLEFTNELDIVGPLAQGVTQKHGVLWPPTIHGAVPMLEVVRGGSLMDGEGGDEVLGVTGHRVAPMAALKNRRARNVKSLRSAAGALAPRPIRRARAAKRHSSTNLPWLRHGAFQALVDALSIAEAEEGLSYASSVKRVPTRRSQIYLAMNRNLLAHPFGVATMSPLLNADFIHALANEEGVFGSIDRTSALRRLVPDLLPDEILAREGKTGFREAFNTELTTQFARSWSGGGLDERLVDPIELRRIWSSENGNAMTAALLQTAWLADNDQSR